LGSLGTPLLGHWVPPIGDAHREQLTDRSAQSSLTSPSRRVFLNLGDSITMRS
jgi:hypothetical protein